VIAAPDALAVADRLPQAAPLQPAPDNAQVTPIFCASFCTAAVKACCWPTCTEEVDGVTLTEIAVGVGEGVSAELGLVEVAAQPDSSRVTKMEITHKNVEIRSTNARLKTGISQIVFIFGLPPAPGDRRALIHVQVHQHPVGVVSCADDRPQEK
jgi:hypothetical protein